MSIDRLFYFFEGKIMKILVAAIIAILLPLCAYAETGKAGRTSVLMEKETEEVLKKANSARETISEWMQGYIEGAEAQEEIIHIANDIRNMKPAVSEIPDLIKRRSRQGREIMAKSLEESAEYLKHGDPDDFKKFSALNEKQAREAYRFIKWQSDSIKLYINDIEEDAQGISKDFIAWKKTIIKIEEKAREASLEAEISFIKAAGGNKSQISKDIEKSIKKAESILEEITDAECPKSMETLKKSAIAMQSQMLLFLKGISGLFTRNQDSRDFDNLMKTYREKTSEIKSEAEKFSQNL